MRTLFVKIFLWFWLAMAVVGVTLVVTVSTTDTLEQRGRHIFFNRSLAMHGQMAAAVFEGGGIKALTEYLESLSKVTRLEVFLFDDQGVNLQNQELPKPIQELALQVAQQGEGRPQLSPDKSLLGQGILSPEGKRYIIVATAESLPPFRGDRRRPPPPPIWRFWGTRDAETHVLLIRVLAVLLASGVVCYGLARYLTSPLVRLRRVTHQLAGGDLKARFGASHWSRKDEVTDLGQDFDRMAERIESVVTAQRRLLRDISHELRSPLARLQVAAGLIRQRQTAQPDPELERIELETKRLDAMIEQLLCLTRLQNSKNAAAKSRLHLSVLLQGVVEDADFEAQSQNRSVRIVESNPVFLEGNEELLRSAIENVVRNAVKYTREETEVEVSLKQEKCGPGSFGVIRVRDHGPGVPESELAELFRPFYRVEEARDRQTGGIGLGLAIAEEAVRWHEGSIRAMNAAEGGLVVEIRLPAAAS
jgi:two-component system sensor histidine kinase CpxA